jgi:type II secretory pathway pseudopilin PulG
MSESPDRGRRQDGMAIYVVMLVAALMSALAVTAVSQSGTELAASGRTRASARALYAADAGIQIARNHIAQYPANTNPIDVTLPNGWVLQSRRRSETTPQSVSRDGDFGAPPEGYSLDEGYMTEFYVVNITATALGGGTSALEAKFGRLAAITGGY